MSWESFATKGIISNKRPKTHVSLKERRKKAKAYNKKNVLKNEGTTKKNVLKNGMVKVQQR